MWERAFRRTALALAYTEGFSPRPKVSFGLALPTGAESVAEYLDLELVDPPPDVVALVPRLTEALPIGVDVLAAVDLEDRAPSLQHEVTSCTWEIEVEGADDAALAAAVDRTLAASSLVISRERKGRIVNDDIRPALLSMNVLSAGRLGCELATLERGVRPSELLRALNVGVDEKLVRRTHQWIERDGARREPIPLATTDAPHADVRAS
jgi:radical SAM-linked protein